MLLELINELSRVKIKKEMYNLYKKYLGINLTEAVKNYKESYKTLMKIIEESIRNGKLSHVLKL
jgi:hypothetical protein